MPGTEPPHDDKIRIPYAPWQFCSWGRPALDKPKPAPDNSVPSPTGAVKKDAAEPLHKYINMPGTELPNEDKICKCAVDPPWPFCPYACPALDNSKPAVDNPVLSPSAVKQDADEPLHDPRLVYLQWATINSSLPRVKVEFKGEHVSNPCETVIPGDDQPIPPNISHPSYWHHDGVRRYYYKDVLAGTMALEHDGPEDTA
jgi:hypothetical protein